MKCSLLELLIAAKNCTFLAIIFYGNHQPYFHLLLLCKILGISRSKLDFRVSTSLCRINLPAPYIPLIYAYTSVNHTDYLVGFLGSEINLLLELKNLVIVPNVCTKIRRFENLW